jgi:hypothetical protein
LVRLGLAALLALGGLVLLAARPANAEEQCEWVTGETGQGGYDCQETVPGGGGSGGGEGSGDGDGEPPCDLSLAREAEDADEHYCEGENACWVNNPPAMYPTPDTWPEEPPVEGATYVYKYCYAPDGSVAYEGYTWYTPDQPPIEDLAREAYGELNAPPFTLTFSPPEESVIYIPTWWWAEGAPSGSITGSAALGVVAVAEPDRMEVDPGDGSDTITCDFVTSESDTCTHTYERASGEGGYPARARLVYDVHFEQNGEAFEVEGLPDTFASTWHNADVPVTEVQSNVVR